MTRKRKPAAENGLLASEVVPTTNVDSSSPDSGKRLRDAPRGIEVLVKKAAVDPLFKELLLEQRAAAAEAIHLVLHPNEAAMINIVPKEQLAATISKTEVPQEHRRAFLGTAATAMLAALAGAQEASGAQITPGGFGGFVANLDQHSVNRGRVAEFVAKHLALKEGTVTRQSRIRDLVEDDVQREALRKALEDHFDVALPSREFERIDTVEALSDRITESLEVRPGVLQAILKRTGTSKSRLTHGTLLVDTLNIERSQLASVRRDLSRKLRVHLDWDVFKQLKTVGEIVHYVGSRVALRKQAEQDKKTIPSPASRGVRPDIPPRASFGNRPDDRPE